MSTVEQHCEELKKKLEKEGEQKLKALQQKTGLIPPEKELVALIQAGADTFKAQMGRNMTYGEMREMYG
jgi:hypothetical protein